MLKTFTVTAEHPRSIREPAGPDSANQRSLLPTRCLAPGSPPTRSHRQQKQLDRVVQVGSDSGGPSSVLGDHVPVINRLPRWNVR